MQISQIRLGEQLYCRMQDTMLYLTLAQLVDPLVDMISRVLLRILMLREKICRCYKPSGNHILIVKLCVQFVSMCRKGVHFVSVCPEVQKWTQIETKVTFHPPTRHQKTFFGLK